MKKKPTHTKTVWNGNLKLIIFRLKPNALILWIHGWVVQVRHFLFAGRQKCIPQEWFGQWALLKRSGCCLHAELKPMAVQGQPKGPACPVISLGQEGLVWSERGVHMFCCEVPEEYLGLMLQLQGDGNLECERYKNEEGLNQESLFFYWKTSGKDSIWAADWDFLVGGGF